MLFALSEIGLGFLSLIGVNRLPRSAKLHGLLIAGAAFGAATPLIANFAQIPLPSILAIVLGVAMAALAQAGLWSLVYVATGMPLDALAGRPPTLAAVWGHWRTGFIKGAIYGGVFMALVLVTALVLRQPGAVDCPQEPGLARGANPRRPRVSARADADRQRRRHAAVFRAPQGRLSRPLELRQGLRHRPRLRVCLFRRSRRGERRRQVSRRVRDRRARLCRRRLADRLAARFERRAHEAADMAQICARRRARRVRRRRARLVFRSAADQCRHHQILGVCRRQLSRERTRRSATSSPTRCSTNTAPSTSAKSPAAFALFWAELVAGVINWALAAPLFSINVVLLSALLDRTLRPLRELISTQGVLGSLRTDRARVALGPLDGADHQHVPAPTARSHLVQSGRRGAHAGRDRRRYRPARTRASAISA